MAYEEAAFSENPHQNQNQRSFTAKPLHGADAKGAEENKTLPMMNADDTDVRKLRASETMRQRAEALVRKIGEACDELEGLAEENPELVGRVTSNAAEPKDAYLRLNARLELANMAPRCRWVRQDGTSCGSPQLKKHIYCFAHRQMMEARALMLALPAAEDANAIQIGLMRLQKAMIDDTISMKKAGLLLYSMQLALQNVGRTTFGQVKTEELVTETVDEREAISQNQKLFTTGDTEENQGLPLINADGRGWEDRPKPVEWKPTPDMYRMDTPEGREAYEARFGMKIEPRVDRAIPPQAAHHQTRAEIGTPPRVAESPQ